MKPGIIIQARTGSARLQGKVLKPFYEGKTILEIIIEKVLPLELPVVLATSRQPNDAILEHTAKKYGINFYTGDENNVLKRFIDSAEKFNLDVIIRVCADNPFICPDYITQLISAYNSSAAAYINFFNKAGEPMVKSHYGFFAELVELKALKKISSLTSEPLFTEHVTNYIYTYPQCFSIKKLYLSFNETPEIRLTIDTEEDYKIALEVYKKYGESSPEVIIRHILSEEKILEKMQTQIIRNTK